MGSILQLKIQIDGIEPKIWRRFLVKENINFHGLHKIIQIVMRWGDYHLYSFYVNKEEISLPDPDFRNGLLNAKKIKLGEKLLLKQKIGYMYDFGDGWEHKLTVEKILSDKDAVLIPLCLEGERACPPEDCGSYPGYYELMDLKKNKKHPNYKERIAEWLGEDFDFEHFDVDETNKELLQLVKVEGRTRIRCRMKINTPEG